MTALQQSAIAKAEAITRQHHALAPAWSLERLIARAILEARADAFAVAGKQKDADTVRRAFIGLAVVDLPRDTKRRAG